MSMVAVVERPVMGRVRVGREKREGRAAWWRGWWIVCRCECRLHEPRKARKHAICGSEIVFAGSYSQRLVW